MIRLTPLCCSAAHGWMRAIKKPGGHRGHSNSRRGGGSTSDTYLQWDWHIIYVRVTTDEADLPGGGELPQVLLEWDKEMHGKDRAVVRVHFESNGTLRLIRLQNVIPKFQFMANEIKRKLLGRRPAINYLKMAGGKPAC